MAIYKFKLLTQGNLFTYETNARTFGEFKEEIRTSSDLRSKFGVSDSSDLSELHLIERSTKTSYVVDSAVMPSTNALFFVSLTKSKGGAMFGESFFSRDMSGDDADELAEYLNEQYDAEIDTLLNTKEEVLDQIEDFYAAQKAEEEEVRIPKTIDLRTMSSKEKLEAVADLLLNISLQLDDDADITGVCIEGVTFEQLEKEADEIYSKLVSLGLIR